MIQSKWKERQAVKNGVIKNANGLFLIKGTKRRGVDFKFIAMVRK